MAIRDIQNQALLGWAKCDGDDCAAMTRQVTVAGNGSHCPQEGCTGRLKPLFTSRDVHQHFMYLVELCAKYRPEAVDVAQEAIDNNAYDTINLIELFGSFAIKGA